MRKTVLTAIFAAFVVCGTASAEDGFVLEKHLVKAPAPYGQPHGAVTPDGTFNIRKKGSPFYSDKLADAMALDDEGRLENGEYLDLNHAVYTSYRLAGDKGAPDTVLVLMPGTWAGAMSMDRFARDLLRMSKRAGNTGIEVWLMDRRSEQLEDHTAMGWAVENTGSMSPSEIVSGISDYYRPAFEPGEEHSEISGRKFVPLDQDAVRFMANWGADVAIRDWRAVVMEAHRAVGNEVTDPDEGEPYVSENRGGRVFIGGHSLGGSLTVMYASYDFDRRPDKERLGMDDVDGLVLLEGGGLSPRKIKTVKAKGYLKDLAEKFEDGKVYFDLDILGIQYAPSTMLSVPIMGWAAHNAPEEECEFPLYARPETVQMPHVTNRAVLGFAMDDDTAPFFIARVSAGMPAGDTGMGGELRYKTVTVPADPGECRLLTAWKPFHRVKDPDFVYSWKNIDENPKHPDHGKFLWGKCTKDAPEVTDIDDYARSLYAGPLKFEEAPYMFRGPNDFPEWYFPPRLSTDSRHVGEKIVEEDGTELLNATHVNDIDLPVISFVGDDSMGEYSVPELSEEDFTVGALSHPETDVHNLIGYTHLDITAATRNNQPDLADGFEDYNACAVYSYWFMEGK